MPLSLSSLNPFGGTKAPMATEQPNEVELTTATESSAPAAPVVVETTASTNKFESNLGRLYSHREGDSKLKTWAIRILSTLLVFPAVLTAIVDIGRRLAFAAGAIDGKSWSLIDKVTGGCKAVADKVSSVYKSFTTTKPATLEELNEKSKEAIQSLAEKLVDGYKAFKDCHFGSSSARRGEREIEKAHADLGAEVRAYVSRNATGTDDFVSHLEVAERIVQTQISKAAGEEFYVGNIVVRTGPQPKLAVVAFNEFMKAQNGSTQIAHEFVSFARNEPDFAASLKKGVDANILTDKQAKTVLSNQVQAVYSQGLETGLEEAVNGVAKLLDSAVQNSLVTKEQAAKMDERIQPEVEALALAAAKDVHRYQDPKAVVTEAMATQQLSKAADGLKKAKKLKPENETQFLTAAKAQLAKAKEHVEAEAQKLKKEAEEVEAQKVAEVQKASDQTSLLNTFLGMLGLISKKQQELTAQFLKFDDLETTRRGIADQLDTIRTSKVTVHGREMTVLDAAGEYYKAYTAISNSNATPSAKEQQINDLANKGFSQTTIDKINEMNALDPKHKEVLGQLVALSQEIDAQHEALATLNAQYKVYRTNNLGGLETANRKVVVEKEKKVTLVQKTLDVRHRQLVHGDTGLIGRLRSEPLRVVNVDPAGNRAEVEALSKAFLEDQAPGEMGVPNARSIPRIILSGLKHGVTAPFSAVSGLWAKRAKTAVEFPV